MYTPKNIEYSKPDRPDRIATFSMSPVPKKLGPRGKSYPRPDRHEARATRNDFQVLENSDTQINYGRINLVT